MKKTKVITLLFFVLVTIAGCHKKQILEKPERLIPYDKLVNIIADSYLIESNVYMAPQDSDRVVMSKELYYDMFKSYKVTKDEFIASINYYLGDEDLANKMMAEASDRLAKKRKEYFKNKEMPEEESESPDPSIKKVPL
jgi:hypothetical protein